MHWRDLKFKNDIITIMLLQSAYDVTRNKFLVIVLIFV